MDIYHCILSGLVLLFAGGCLAIIQVITHSTVRVVLTALFEVLTFPIVLWWDERKKRKRDDSLSKTKSIPS